MEVHGGVQVEDSPRGRMKEDQSKEIDNQGTIFENDFCNEKEPKDSNFRTVQP